MTKKELRSIIIKNRKEIPESDWNKACESIYYKVVNNEKYTNAKHILLYSSYNGEVDTYSLFDRAINDKKNVYMPKVFGDGIMDFFQVNSIHDLMPGCMGIMEPKIDSCKKFDVDMITNENVLMIVPGVAFDYNYYRLGYGGGFYDRYIEKCRNINADNICCMAIAFSLQMVDAIENLEPTDEMMDVIITDISMSAR